MKFNTKYIAALILTTPIILSGCGGGSSHTDSHTPQVHVTTSTTQLSVETGQQSLSGRLLGVTDTPKPKATITFTVSGYNTGSAFTITANDPQHKYIAGFDAGTKTCSINTSSETSCSISVNAKPDDIDGEHETVNYSVSDANGKHFTITPSNTIFTMLKTSYALKLNPTTVTFTDADKTKTQQIELSTTDPTVLKNLAISGTGAQYVDLTACKGLKQGSTCELTVKPPSDPGTYDFDITTNDGSVSDATGNVIFSKSKTSYALKLNPTTVTFTDADKTKTQQIELSTTDPTVLKNLAISGTGAQYVDLSACKGLKQGATCELTVKSPSDPGTYDFDITANDGSVSDALGNVIFSKSIHVAHPMLTFASDYPACDPTTGQINNAKKMPLQVLTDSAVNQLSITQNAGSAVSATCTANGKPSPSCDPSQFSKYGQGTTINVSCKGAKPGVYPINLDYSSPSKNNTAILHVVVPDTGNSHTMQISTNSPSLKSAAGTSTELRLFVNSEPMWVVADPKNPSYSAPQAGQSYYLCGFNDQHYPDYYLSTKNCNIGLTAADVEANAYTLTADGTQQTYAISKQITADSAQQTLNLQPVLQRSLEVDTNLSGDAVFPYYLHLTDAVSQYTYSYKITDKKQTISIPATASFNAWAMPASVADKAILTTPSIAASTAALQIELHHSSRQHLVMPYLDIGAGGGNSSSSLKAFQFMNWTSGGTNLISHQGVKPTSDVIDQMPIDGVNWAFLQGMNSTLLSEPLRAGFTLPAASSAVIYQPIVGLRSAQGTTFPKVLGDLYVYQAKGHAIYLSQGGYSGTPIWATESSSPDLLYNQLDQIMAEMHPAALDFDLEQGFEGPAYKAGTDTLLTALKKLRAKYPDLAVHWTLAVNAAGFPTTALDKTGGILYELSALNAFDSKHDVINLMAMDWSTNLTDNLLFNGMQFLDLRDKQPKSGGTLDLVSHNVFTENILASLNVAASQFKNMFPDASFKNFGLTPMIGENDTYFSGAWFSQGKYDFGSRFSIDDANCLYQAMSGKSSAISGSSSFKCPSLQDMNTAVTSMDKDHSMNLTQNDLSQIAFLSYWSLNRDRTDASTPQDMLGSVDLTKVGSGSYPASTTYDTSYDLFAKIFQQFD